MTRATRRILYASAFGIFILLAPPIVLWTAGWHWNGWHEGLSRSGVIVVTSQPRAELRMDTRSVGTTPEQIRGLRPGVYQLSLTRAGYRPWQQAVRVEAGLATIVGPVELARKTPRVISGGQFPQPGFWLSDEDQSRLVWVNTKTDGAVIHAVRPNKSSTTWRLPFVPKTLLSSPGGEVLVLQDGGQQAVIRVTQSAVWESPLVGQIDWSDVSENIFVGQAASSVFVFDVLAQSVEKIGPATSAVLAFGNIWATERVGESTILQRRPYPGQTKFINLLAENGTWTLWPSRVNALLFRSESTRETRLWTVSPQLNQRGIGLGAMDRFFWSDRRVPLIWQSGVSLLTLDTDQHPALIERTPEEFFWLGWQVPRHVLVSLSSQALHIQSVSSRQGRDEIANYRFPPDARVIVSPAKRLAWIGSADGRLEEWEWQ